jgi:hypothetical protein
LIALVAASCAEGRCQSPPAEAGQIERLEMGLVAALNEPDPRSRPLPIGSIVVEGADDGDDQQPGR